MSIQNEIMLITYADSMGKDLKELGELLNTHFKGIVGGVHILPFYPSTADRGFAPTTYEVVDPVFGTWEDIQAFQKNYYTMYDFMINHISRGSEYFQDYLALKEDSKYKDLFIVFESLWPNGGPTQKDIDLIYKRKPRAPYVETAFADGSKANIWCTFDEEQIDLNMYTEATRAFVKDALIKLAKRGASLIRLDAFAYATKRPGTNCMFLEPDTWDMLDFVKETLEPYGVEILPEIHEHYSIQMKLAERGYWVYDFALPLIMLHTLYTGNNERLKHWLSISPSKQFTTLDTHDGIGVVDAKDLMSDEELEATREGLYQHGANVKKIYSSTAYNNLDIYQMNCTYYSALGDNDDAYLLARAIQFFAPGIPQVYYIGMLAGANDLELLEETKVGRNINRHYYSKEEVAANLERSVVKKLMALMSFRNSYKAFEGDIELHDSNPEELGITRTSNGLKATLWANLKTHSFTIEYKDPETGEMKALLDV